MRQVVSSSSIPLVPAGGGTDSYLLKNKTASAIIYLEFDAPAASGTGYEWATGDGPITIDIPAGSTLNAISAGVDQTVHILRLGH